MNPVPGHDMEGEEIPEQNVFYRLLKKKYFLDLELTVNL